MASQGWTYRDLHPNNIHRVTPKGAMLLDFDNARPAGWPAQPAGRAGYRAPELDWGGEVSAACDVYSLAVCLYFALSGQDPPLDPGPLTDVRDQLASFPQLIDVLDWCRREDPSQRPRAQAFRAALEGRISPWMRAQFCGGDPSIDTAPDPKYRSSLSL